jgi:ankyrin repeat protein
MHRLIVAPMLVLFLTCASAGTAEVQGELNRALARGDLEAAQAALDHGADINFCYTEAGDCWTNLHMIAPTQAVHVAEWILQHGGDPNSRASRDGRTPLHVAAGAGRVEMVRLLLQWRADAGAEAKDPRTGEKRTPLDEAKKVGDAGARAQLIELLERPRTD